MVISSNARSRFRIQDGLPATPHDGDPFAAITATGSSLFTDRGRLEWNAMHALTSALSKPGPADGLTNGVVQPTNENSATLNPNFCPAMFKAGIQLPTYESPKMTIVFFAVVDPYQHGEGSRA